jgi:hypothetical protein
MSLRSCGLLPAAPAGRGCASARLLNVRAPRSLRCQELRVFLVPEMLARTERTEPPREWAGAAGELLGINLHSHEHIVAGQSAPGDDLSHRILRLVPLRVVRVACRRQQLRLTKVPLFSSQAGRHFGTELGTPKPAVFALDAATSVRSNSLFEPMIRSSCASTSTRWASARAYGLCP